MEASYTFSKYPSEIDDYARRIFPMKNMVKWIVIFLILTLLCSSVAFAFDELSKGSKGNEVLQLQNRLNELGYSVGKADGDYGNKTQKAVEAFQQNNDLEVTGTVNENTYNVLFSQDAVAANSSNQDNGISELVEFNSVMMESVSDQISSAVDLTTTSTNRAILAALLSLEFTYQRYDFTFDYNLPIFVCKSGQIASVAMGGKDSYALIIYQMNPLSTSYGIIYGNDPNTIKATLSQTNDSVWTVSLDDYNEKLAALVDQL